MGTSWRFFRRSVADKMAVDIRLLDAAFDPAAELSGFTAAHRDAGGLVSFLGQVRSSAGVEGAASSSSSPSSICASSPSSSATRCSAMLSLTWT